MSTASELAHLKRLDQGNHECEVLPEGVEAAHLWDNCTKNPGHDKFIPVKRFSLNHLPNGCQNKDLFECIRNIAELTVRVVVKFASSDRPDGYPFSNSKGDYGVPHTGSGYVGMPFLQNDYFEFAQNKPCPCPECERSSTPAPVWWICHVLTARHVVYNDEEARNTTVDVFFDDDSRSTVKKLYGYGMIAPNTDKDLCEVYCGTHDSEVANKLNECLNKGYDIIDRFHKDSEMKKARLCVVVSHPHGRSKHISIGRWTEFLQKGEKEINEEASEYKIYTYFPAFKYSTQTCAGSSGGPVFVLDLWAQSWFDQIHTYYYCHTHSEGSTMDGENVNSCCFTEVLGY